MWASLSFFTGESQFEVVRVLRILHGLDTYKQDSHSDSRSSNSTAFCSSRRCGHPAPHPPAEPRGYTQYIFASSVARSHGRDAAANSRPKVQASGLNGMWPMLCSQAESTYKPRQLWKMKAPIQATCRADLYWLLTCLPTVRSSISLCPLH